MKIQRSRYFLGGIGVLLLLLVGALWAVAAVASPSGQTQGTIALDDTYVRSDCGAGSADDCTLKVTVNDADLSKPVAVGHGKDRSVSVTITKEVSAARFNTLVVDIDGGMAFTAQDADDKGTVSHTPDRDGVLPIVGSVSIDYDNSTGIGSSKSPDVEVARDRVQGGKQLIDLKLNKNLDANDVIALSYNTSDEEGTVASVRGDEGTMYLNLQEQLGGTESGFGGQGKYAGTFEVAKSVTIDVNDIKGEQHMVPAGLRSGRQFTENLEVGDADIADNGTVEVTVSNPTLRDNDKDGDIADDIKILRGEVEDPVVVNAGTGTITFTATDDIKANSTIRISYYGDDHFNIDLDYSPARDDLTESDIAVPQPGMFSDLYKWRKATRSRITLSVEANTPSNGAVLAVSYKGTQTVVNQDGDIAAGGEFEVELIERANTVPVNITVLGDNGSTTDVNAVATGDGKTWARVTFTAGADPVKDGQSFYIHYDDMEFPKAFNPQNALDAEATTRPILKVDPSPAGEARAIYDDVTGGDASIVATVENSGPSVSGASPANGSSFAPANAPTLSVVITDMPAPPLGSGVDTDTVEFYVSTAGAKTMTGGQTFTGDLSTDDAGVVTASLPLINDPNKRTDELNIKDGDAPNISWWVTVADKVGNETTSDAKPDDKDDKTTDDVGNQPYTLKIDTTAPKSVDENTVTGQYYDASEKDSSKRIKDNRRNSIRLAFDDPINADSVDADDFTVTSGGATIAVESADVQGSDIYLTLAEDLSSDATPTVTVLATDDRITNTAGNMLATGDIKVSDYIDPGISVSLSKSLSTGDLSVTVATDEDIISVPSVDLYFGDTRIRAVGSAKRTSPTVNEWTFAVTITERADGSDDGDNNDSDGVYSVISSALDKARNRAEVGNKDTSKDNAIKFEIDTDLDNLMVEDDGDFDTLSSGDLVGETDIYYFGLKWNDDKEYDGDSHKGVTLTTAVLNSGDKDNEVDLTAGIDPAGSATSFTITAEGLPKGKHTLTVRGVDDAGNKSENVTINFTITELSFDFQLRRGVNHISLPRNPANMDINAVFGEVSQVTSVFTYVDGTPKAAFRDPATNEFVGDLTQIDASHAYGVESTGSVKITIAIPNVSGSVAPPTVMVNQGWNFVPVITLDDINVINDQPVMDADAYLGFGWTSGWTFFNSRWTSIAPDPKNDNLNCDNDAQESGEVHIGRGYWVYYEGASSLNPGSVPTKASCTPSS